MAELLITGSPFDQIATLGLNLLFTGAVALLAYFARRAWKTLIDAHTKLDHLDKCMDGVKESSERDREDIRKHVQEAQIRDRRIAELEKNYAGLEGYFKGMQGMRLDSDINELEPKQS